MDTLIGPAHHSGRNPCRVEGCEKPRAMNGYCSKHGQRVKAHGTHEINPYAAIRGANSPRWKGGRSLDSLGYITVKIFPGDPLYTGRSETRGEGQRIKEHRLVMARALGRPLLPSESVHHINGKRDDNRLENLQLRQGKHGAGVRYRCNTCGSHDVSEAAL